MKRDMEELLEVLFSYHFKKASKCDKLKFHFIYILTAILKKRLDPLSNLYGSAYLYGRQIRNGSRINKYC